MERITDKVFQEKVYNRYYARPYKPFDGNYPLYCDKHDEWFYDEEDIENFLEEHELGPGDLWLLICDGNFAHKRPLTSEWWADDFPEDHEGGIAEKKLQVLIDEFNEKLKSIAEPLSYSPGKYRTYYNI